MILPIPRLYVGTYAKYNSGALNGDWLDLDDYSDKEAFLEACKELHKDEADPEFMFQDFEGFPRELYNEGYVTDALFEYVALDEDDRQLLGVYLEHVNQDGDIYNAREAFVGKAENRAAFAEQLLEEQGALQGVPEHLVGYFDYDAYARDLEQDGFTFVRCDGELWVFTQ